MVQVCVGGRAQGPGKYCRHAGSHSDTAPGPAHTGWTGGPWGRGGRHGARASRVQTTTSPSLDQISVKTCRNCFKGPPVILIYASVGRVDSNEGMPQGVKVSTLHSCLCLSTKKKPHVPCYQLESNTIQQ